MRSRVICSVLNACWMGSGLVLLACQLGLTHDWSTDVCRSFSGFSISYEALFLLFCIHELYSPLYEQTANFSCCCSLASTVAIVGMYASSVVGLAVFPTDHAWVGAEVCLPIELAKVIFAFVISSAFYTMVLIVASVVLSSISLLSSPSLGPAPNPAQQPTPDAPARQRGLSADQISTIQVIQVRPNGECNAAEGAEAAEATAKTATTVADITSASICAICLVECTGRVKLLPCGHQFHAECIDGWLIRRNSCVLCRQPPVFFIPSA